MTVTALPGEVTSALAEARQLYIALVSKQGPHVTPELYAWSGDKLWFAAATSTLKARVLATGDSVATVVVGRGRSVIVEGEVEVFDPRRPVAAARGDVRRAMAALVSFGVRNATDLIGFARDSLTGALPRIPNARVLIAVDPARVALVENDRVVWQRGWRAVESPPDGDVPAGGVSAVAAVDGPHVLPARWFAHDQRLFVARDLAQLLGVGGTIGVAIVVDEYNAPGPAAKQGTLLRGSGTVDEDGWIKFTADKTTEWDGIEMRSS